MVAEHDAAASRAKGAETAADDARGVREAVAAALAEAHEAGTAAGMAASRVSEGSRLSSIDRHVCVSQACPSVLFLA